MSAERVNFKELRERLSFARILQHYNVNLSEKGDQWHGFCPLPTHPSKKTGKPRSPSFSANVGKGIFQCFGCGVKGNLLEFAARMEGLDPDDSAQFRKAALKLKHEFMGDDQPAGKPKTPAKPPSTGEEKKEEKPVTTTPDLAEVINAPLGFELTSLEADHPYLAMRGFTPATVALFGIGFTSRGLMRGRIAIPLRNQSGELIGYAGRLVDETAIDEDNPKYRFPSDREKDGTRYVFRKSEFLYNADRAKAFDNQPLIIVEGFPSVWWLTQNDIRRVIAVMGASLSEQQTQRIIEMTVPETKVFVFSDGDKAGDRMAESVLRQVAPHRFIRWLRSADDKQPTDYNQEELNGFLV